MGDSDVTAAERVHSNGLESTIHFPVKGDTLGLY